MTCDHDTGQIYCLDEAKAPIVTLNINARVELESPTLRVIFYLHRIKAACLFLIFNLLYMQHNTILV